jgi:IMP dehydrogenase
MNSKVEYYSGQEALAFSDVYLKPVYSDIRSRFSDQVDTSTLITRVLPRLKIPFISAGMDTVTEDEMAIELALLGGLGEIHRNCLPEGQAEMVRHVKEKMRKMATNPPQVSDKATIKDALELLRARNRGYVLVYKGNMPGGKIIGIATDKDFLAGSSTTNITEVMTPLTGGKRNMLFVGPEVDLEKASQIMIKNRIEKLPVIDDKGILVGVYTLKDFMNFRDYPNATLDGKGRLMVGAAIGVREVDIERALRLIEAGVDILFLDIAHGHSIYSKEMIKRLKVTEKVKTPIIVGNVATREGVKFAVDIGADGVKVGIGPRFVCKTRNVAGTGVPQITAVMEAREVVSKMRSAPPIISDGGVREPGDVSKAIAAGADSVMIGSILAGTEKSPGDIVKINGMLQKEFVEWRRLVYWRTE